MQLVTHQRRRGQRRKTTTKQWFQGSEIRRHNLQLRRSRSNTHVWTKYPKIRDQSYNRYENRYKSYDRELCELRHKRGKFFESDPLCSSEQIDKETKDCINNECSSFIQSLLSRWNSGSDTNYSSTFGSHQSVLDDGVVINAVVNASLVCRSVFQQKW